MSIPGAGSWSWALAASLLAALVPACGGAALAAEPITPPAMYPPNSWEGRSAAIVRVLDKLDAAIKAYMTTIEPEAMADVDYRRVSDILAFATNMEYAGDVVDKNLLGLMARKIKRGITFSKEGQAELLGMVDRLLVNLRTTATVFMTEDVRAARLLAAEKEVFRDIEAHATIAHFERMRAGNTETAETSTLHLDMLRDLARVNTHLIAAAAYPVLEGKGELLPSRIKGAETGNGE